MRLLTFLLLNGIIVHILILVWIFYVEPFKVGMKVEMLKVIRAEGKLADYQIDVLVFQLELMKQLDQILSGDCLLPIFDVLKRYLQLTRVCAGHLSNPKNHLLFLLLLKQLEVINYFAQLRHKNRLRDDVRRLNAFLLVAILQEGCSIIGS
jgi:hypothetical protein